MTVSALVVAVSACTRVAPNAGPTPRMGVDFARPLQIYRQLGLLTGPDEFPAVGGIETLAGPVDSTLVLFGLSFPANVFRFQRDGDAFAAEYVVALRFARDGRPVRLVDRRETVRVPSFAETGRSDESVLFQTSVTLEPGAYEVTVRVRDGLSARGFEALDTVVIPAYGPAAAALSPPLPVYEGTPRTDVDDPPRLILNPRHTAPYGGPAPRVYLERYAGAGPVELLALDERDRILWSRRLAADTGFVAHLVTLPTDSVPLGALRLVVETESGERSAFTPLLVTISDGWLVANFDEVLAFLRYIASVDELQALREGTPEERRAAWDRFWAARDPVPATPSNEYRANFFQRIRIATEQFSEPGTPGWRTDRGEVYIVLGPPSQVIERRLKNDRAISGRGGAQQWIYERTSAGRLDLVFVDRTGFGTYEMTPSSESAFRQVATRLKLRTMR